MACVIYIKKQPKLHSSKLPRISLAENPKRDRFFFLFIALVGLVSMLFAAWPFLVWQVKTLPRLSAKIEKFPIPKAQVLSATSTLTNVQVVKDEDGFSYFVPTSFPKENSPTPQVNNQSQGPRPKEFFLSIPKLKIEGARVKVDSLKFDTSLAHFPGSALPGEIGNPFITGHSVLPQFNDPKNYRAIFTRLSDLEVGDDVSVEIGDQKLHFVVQYVKIVDPHDTSVINPISPNGRNLTLMTCVPPGTNSKRLVVITSLI